jgi:hypothetical protein
MKKPFQSTAAAAGVGVALDMHICNMYLRVASVS